MNKSPEPCKYEKCSHPKYLDEDFCIFHMPKLTKEEKEKLSPQPVREYSVVECEFRKQLFEMIRNITIDPAIIQFNFSGFQFVEIDLSTELLSSEITYWQGFKKPVVFSMTSFKAKTDFYFTKFYANVDFSGAIFNDKVDFVGTNFEAMADFSGVTFKEKANFIGATFKALTIFSPAFFKNEAIFFSVNFGPQAKGDFSGAIFEAKANFSAVVFDGNANFSGASFCAESDFSHSYIKKWIFFKGTNENRIFQGNLTFHELSLNPEAKVIFEKTHLTQASFIDTNIGNFEFHDVKWPIIKRRKFLWDEFYNGNVDLSKLADNYHQLVLNYESRREFDTALDFHIGEMEVRRKQKAEQLFEWSRNFVNKFILKSIIRLIHWTWNWIFNTHAWYRYLNYYGTSYWRAAGFLTIFVTVFSWVFLMTGFQQSGISSPINYDWSSSISLFNGLWSHWWSAVGFSLSVLTLQSPSYYSPAGPWSHFWVGVARIVFYAQVALLLLAIRRRFKQ